MVQSYADLALQAELQLSILVMQKSFLLFSLLSLIAKYELCRDTGLRESDVGGIGSILRDEHLRRFETMISKLFSSTRTLL